jgi:hypothetical protein
MKSIFALSTFSMLMETLDSAPFLKVAPLEAKFCTLFDGLGASLSSV